MLVKNLWYGKKSTRTEMGLEFTVLLYFSFLSCHKETGAKEERSNDIQLNSNKSDYLTIDSIDEAERIYRAIIHLTTYRRRF